MKLYFKPGACSLASHIILRETGADFKLEKVDTVAGTTETGENYREVNPKGYVPSLKLSDGTVLSEGASVLQYLGTDHGLAPKSGSLEGARLQEYLNYTSSELHKAFGPFFRDGSSDAEKAVAGKQVAAKFRYLESLFKDGRSFLLGDSFSVADAYLFVVANWSNFVGIDLDRWPRVKAFVERVANRPSAQAAMKAEGLI